MKHPLKGRLFGLDRGQVRTYLRKLRRIQNKESTVLQENIAAIRKLNDKLSEESALLEVENREKRKQLELNELAEQRLMDSIRALQRLGEKEVKSIEEESENKRHEHDLKVQQIEQQIDVYEKKFHTLMEELSELINKIEQVEPDHSNKLTFEKHASAAAEDDNNEPSSISEVAASRNRYEPLESEASQAVPEINDGELASLQNRAKIVQFKLKSMVTNQNHSEKNQAAVQEAAAEHRGQTGKTAESSAFWGNIRDYMGMESGGVREEFVMSQPPEPAENNGKPGDAAKSAERMAKQDASAGEEHKQESPVVSKEISAIRNRYIVGKLAGESLYGQDGQLIILKNEKITPEAVERADREGKLPDLIVQMVIPDLKDDSER